MQKKFKKTVKKETIKCFDQQTNNINYTIG